MIVYVINRHGRALMPCSPRKARLLLRDKKAEIISYKPFTIKLLYGSRGYTQPVDVGIDLGSKYVGTAVVSEGKVLEQGQIELRQDIKKLLMTRRILRRSRRSRKTRYRKARFLNRKRKDGWLPPSIQSRIDNIFRHIDKLISLLPNPKLHIEVGKFDVQKMKNPDIQGIEYQQGDSYDFYSTRYYVFDRDKYTCQVCKKKNRILRTHHIIYRSHGGSDKADNLITVCTECHTHENHQEGGIFHKWMMEGKKLKEYKDPPFMNIIRRRTFERYPNAHITYGNITTPDRRELGLPKTHYNDAIAITGVREIKEKPESVSLIVQFRKKKRSLHEATARKGEVARKSSKPNIERRHNTIQKRNNKNTKERYGIKLNDSVIVYGKHGFVNGFTNGGVYVTDIYGNYICGEGKKHKIIPQRHVRVTGHNNNWRYGQFISPLTEAGEFLP